MGGTKITTAITDISNGKVGIPNDELELISSKKVLNTRVDFDLILKPSNISRFRKKLINTQYA
jgi:hypothetical protein